MITLVEFVGLVATVFSTVTLVPSVYYQWSHKSPGGTSIMLLCQVLFNASLWLTYGVLANDLYVFTRSLIAGLICTLSIVLYYKYKG